jgi:hypothetical protein
MIAGITDIAGIAEIDGPRDQITAITAIPAIA